jgi:hypothetical protein
MFKASKTIALKRASRKINDKLGRAQFDAGFYAGRHDRKKPSFWLGYRLREGISPSEKVKQFFS